MKAQLLRKPSLVAVVAAFAFAVVSTAVGSVLVVYSATTGLPPVPPWEFVSNGPVEETSQHTVFVDAGVLHLIDNALFIGNSLGYIQPFTAAPGQVTTVEFRCRVPSGESAIDDQHAPFDVGLYNGSYAVDLAVGPNLLSAIGQDPQFPNFPIVILDVPFDGTEWHTYRYKLSPADIRWFVDGVFLARTGVDRVLPIPGQGRVHMLISSAAATVELSSLSVTSARYVMLDVQPGSPLATIAVGGAAVIRAAILSTDSFDATTVDPSTIRFGHAGTEAAPLRRTVQDVDHDGRNDLLLDFATRQTGLQCGDAAATLTAKTASGEDVEGADSIRVVPCK